MAVLEQKITFDPPKYVTFDAIPKEQVRDVTITNTTNQTTMYKMKTTRPGVFKMKPVYFSIQPNQKKTVKLQYSGCPDGVKPNLKDRFSVIMAIMPKSAPADWEVEKIWEDPKMQVELADSVKRKVLRIHYEGYEVPAEMPDKSEKRSKKKKKKGPKESTDDKIEKEKFAAAVAANALAQVAGQPQPFPHIQPIVYIVYQGLPPKEEVEAK